MYRTAVLATLVTACGGGTGPRQPQLVEPRLVTSVVGQAWYRATTTCAQGPYEIEVPAVDAKWGQGVDLMLATPRKLALHAVLLVDDKEVTSTDAVFDASGRTHGKPDNARCIADAKERLVLRSTGGAGGRPGTPGTPAEPGRLVVPPPDRPLPGSGLDRETGVLTGTATLISFELPELVPGAPVPRIRIRFWSIEPNDLVDVHFGMIHVIKRPNVSEEQYVAHLRWKVEEAERTRVRMVEEQRLADEQWRRAHPPKPGVVVDVEAERLRELERAAETKRREAREAERALRRKEHCAAPPRDTGCWGAGGLEVHLDLERHRGERDAYCASNQQDARCWTEDQWSQRRVAWTARAQAALAPPPPPDGPPPEALVEVVPPKLSVHAEWRPGYWEWTSGRWVWLAGMWRVPDEDIASEQTTTAPAPPPPVQAEVAPPPPVAAVVWIGGFWQWNTTAWVWIPGSYQLRPEPRVQWRAPEWRPRGRVHVLIPGGWVRIGGGR
ncbi:MAG: hypothetical protein ABI175_15260 [Polyangiales bacterium]